MGMSFYSSSKGRLLFSLRGRIPRTDFWVGLVVVVGITTLAFLLNGHRVRGGSLGQFFGVVAAIAMLSPYCLTALVVKRFHDLDRSGWYVLTMFIAFLLAALAATAHSGLRDSRILEEYRHFWTIVSYVSAGLAAALLVSLIAILGFTRGTLGHNRFGPDAAVRMEELPADKLA